MEVCRCFPSRNGDHINWSSQLSIITRVESARKFPEVNIISPSAQSMRVESAGSKIVRANVYSCELQTASAAVAMFVLCRVPIRNSLLPPTIVVDCYSADSIWQLSLRTTCPEQVVLPCSWAKWHHWPCTTHRKRAAGSVFAVCNCELRRQPRCDTVSSFGWNSSLESVPCGQYIRHQSEDHIPRYEREHLSISWFVAESWNLCHLISILIITSPIHMHG